MLLLGTKAINNLSFNRPGEVSCDYVAFEKDQISMCSHGMSLRQKEEDRMLCRLALGMYVCAHVDTTSSIFLCIYVCVCVQAYIYKPMCDITFLLSTLLRQGLK